MQVCANCGHTNRPGVLFCENCGTSLTGKAAVGTTKSFEEANTLGATREQITAAGTDYFLPGSILRLEIEGGPEPILVRPRQELVFGRRDPATGAMPDIDLTPYAGYRMGVSRRHAAIRTAEENYLDVWDLGSSNGTFLNGQRLNAHRPYRLRDGDRLRLGQMVIRVFFQPPAQTARPETQEAEEAAAEALAIPLLSPTPTREVPEGDAQAAEAEEEPVASPVAQERATEPVPPTPPAEATPGQAAVGDSSGGEIGADAAAEAPPESAAAEAPSDESETEEEEEEQQAYKEQETAPPPPENAQPPRDLP